MLLRWIGSRTISQLSTVEFLLVIALGSAVGDVTFYPEVPILHALVVVTAVVLINKTLDIIINRFEMAKKLVDGQPVEVVRNGVVTSEGLSHRNLAVPELFEMLRINGIANLAEVSHAYIEPGGKMSVFRKSDVSQGLPLVPLDRKAYSSQDASGPTALLACSRCGTTRQGPVAEPDRCDHCGAAGWAMASKAQSASTS